MITEIKDNGQREIIVSDKKNREDYAAALTWWNGLTDSERKAQSVNYAKISLEEIENLFAGT